MSMFYEQVLKLFSGETIQQIEVEPNHPLLIAEKEINWDLLIEEIEPIIYPAPFLTIIIIINIIFVLYFYY